MRSTEFLASISTKPPTAGVRFNPWGSHEHNLPAPIVCLLLFGYVSKDQRKTQILCHTAARCLGYVCSTAPCDHQTAACARFQEEKQLLELNQANGGCSTSIEVDLTFETSDFKLNIMGPSLVRIPEDIRYKSLARS